MIFYTGERPVTVPVSTSAALAVSRIDDLTTNLHRTLIGCIGLVLPFILIGLAVWRDGFARWKDLESISAYYYSGAAAAFLGMLVSLALFLFAYRGYDNKNGKWDRRISNWAAIAALVVAFFPTRAPDGMPELLWWTPFTGVLHHVAAIVLLSCFALFSLWLFRKKKNPTTPGTNEQPEESDSGKSTRNGIYVSCGVLIIVGMVWAGVNAILGLQIFWPESLALAAFSVSWLVKGHAFELLHGVWRRGLAKLAGAVRSLVW